MTDDEMQVRIIGPDVSPEHAREVGEAFADLFNAVAEHMTGESARVEVTGLKWMCDCCNRTVQREAKPEQWVNREGLDYCELCQ